MGKQEKYNRVRKIVKGLSEEEKKDITHIEACKIIACEPSVMILAKIVDEHPEINFENTKKIIQEINKRLYKINKYKAPSIMVGTALYLVNKELNQEEAANMVNITTGSLRSTLDLTRLDRKDKAKYAHKSAMEKYEKWQREIKKRGLWIKE